MNELLSDKIEKRIYDILPHEPEAMTEALFIMAMGAYYLWRMFAITPQYDELYTYYNFISRGPIYSAIHWPLPNNHVGYSVLSAILDYTGNPYIGLRGVSYLCAVFNLYLVYRISRRYFAHGLALGASILYASMQVVNEYSVQGRGYSLAATCFLLSVYCAGYICSIDETPMHYYVLLSLSFVLGLYTVPSSIYWVVPVALAIMSYLLINAIGSLDAREKISDSSYFKKFKRAFWYGFVAALITVFLYVLIWLSIGSNLLLKTEGYKYYNTSHFTIILHAPFSAIIEGARYMLDQPYIQSVSASDFKAGCLSWALSLFNYMIPRTGYTLFFVMIAALIIAIIECIRHYAYSRTVINLICAFNIVITTFMLIVQKKLPYLRVFSYFAAVICFCICICAEWFINIMIRVYNKRVLKNFLDTHQESERVRADKWYSGIGVYIPLILICVLFIIRFASPSFNAQLAQRETDVYSTLFIAGVENKENIAVLDCDQQYLLKFGWDVDCIKTDVDGADCVIIDKNMLTPGYSGGDFWKYYQTYETIDWDYIDSMRPIYENENFILYVK